MRGKRLTFPIIILIYTISVIVGLSFFDKRNDLIRKRNQTEVNLSDNGTDEPRPQISSDYSVYEIDSEWNLLVAEDFNISIHIPKEIEIRRGFGFDKYYPEKETASLSFEVPSKQANVIIGIRTGNKLSRSIYEIAEKMSENPGAFGFAYTKVKPRTINNAIGYEFYGSSEKNRHQYNFIVESGKRYIDLWYYYPWSGIDRTFREESIAKETISSFRLLK